MRTRAASNLARRGAAAPSRRLVVFALGAFLGACAPKPPTLPIGAGEPFPTFADAYAAARGQCRDLRTYTAVMALSGKAGRVKLRGRLEAGFEKPGRVRLEGIAPFGRPVFILTADGARGTLVLTREEQVLQDAGADEIVDALAGVALGADALRSAVAGCGLAGDAAPTGGRTYADGRAAIVFPDATAYIARTGTAWTLIGSTRGAITVFYSDVASGRPSTVRFRVQRDGQVTTDLTLRLSQVVINGAIDPRAFVADLPAHPIPITLDALRRAGPLGDTSR